MRRITVLRRRLACEGGITLSEMLIVLVMLGIIVGPLSQLLVSGTHAQLDMTRRFQSQQQARLALDSLRREIHCAKVVSPSFPPPAGPPQSSITITLGWYCQGSGTTLSSALTIPASGTYTVSAADTSAFATTPYVIYVNGAASGAIRCSGKTATSFTVCSGGTAGAYAVGAKVSGTTSYTWCTKDKNGTTPPTAGAPYTLWRYFGAACAGTGRKAASDLVDTGTVTSGQIFRSCTACLTPIGPGTLGTLSIDLPVDPTTASSSQRYELTDDIVLRNSARS